MLDGAGASGVIAVLEIKVGVAKGVEEGLEGTGERGGIRETMIANDEDEAAGSEDAEELDAGGLMIEPMEGLGDSDGIEGGGGESGGLSGGGDWMECGEVAQVLDGGVEHGGVGFDGGDVEACIEKDAGEEAGAGADIRDACGVRERAGLADEGGDGRWVARASAAVGVGAV